MRLKQKYASIALQLRNKPGGVERERYTLGDEVALVPCAAQADSVAFVNAQGSASTGPRKALVEAKSGLVTARQNSLSPRAIY